MSEPLSVRETMIESVKLTWDWMHGGRLSWQGTLPHYYAGEIYNEALHLGLGNPEYEKPKVRALVQQRTKRLWCYWDALVEWNGRIVAIRSEYECGGWSGFHRVRVGDDYGFGVLLKYGYPIPWVENVRFCDPIEFDEEFGCWRSGGSGSLWKEWEKIRKGLTAYTDWRYGDAMAVGHVGEMVDEFDSAWRRSEKYYYTVHRGKQTEMRRIFERDILPEWQAEEREIERARMRASELEKAKVRAERKLRKVRSKRITIKPREIMASTEKLLNLCKPANRLSLGV